eukprot:749274-Hanusia_phi.AAC.6
MRRNLVGQQTRRCRKYVPTRRVSPSTHCTCLPHLLHAAGGQGGKSYWEYWHGVEQGETDNLVAGSMWRAVL